MSGDWLDLGRGYAPGGLGELMAAVVSGTAIDKTDANETYAFKVQEADADAGGSPDAASARDAGFAVAATAVGVVVVKAVVTTRFIRLVLAAGGTTPSITYSANVGK